MERNPPALLPNNSDNNLQSYFRLRLSDYFKATHPIAQTESLLFPPIALLKEMFANIHINNNIPIRYPPEVPPNNDETLSTSLLWQILIYNITFPIDNYIPNEPVNLWQTALNARLAYRSQIERILEKSPHLLDDLKTQTLIHHDYIDNALQFAQPFDFWRLKIHAHSDFYLSLISTFDQAVIEDMIIFCAEENIDLPMEFTELTDNGFIGQILPTIGRKRIIMPDHHFLNLFHQRHEKGAYFYEACLIAEKIGSHGERNYLLGHLNHCKQIRCNDWQDWLAQSGFCARKDIPPLLLDVFFLARAMNKFIQFQNKQLKFLGVENSEEEIIAIYQRYPLYFNQSETFQG